MINRSIVIVTYLFLCSSFLSYALLDRDKAAYAGQQQEWRKAHELLMPLVVDNIDDFFLLYDMGVASYKTEDYEHAQSYFDTVIHAQSVGDQLKEQALFNAGNTAVKRKRLDDAIAYYERALAMAPGNERTKHNLEIAKKMRDDQKRQEQQEKNKEQEQQDQKKDDKQKGQSEQEKDDNQDKQNDQQDKEQRDQQRQDSSDNEQQDNQQQEQNSQNSVDSNRQKNEQQDQKQSQLKSDDKQQGKQQQSDQDKNQRGNPQDRENNEKKQQKQEQREEDLERNLQDKPSNEHKDQNEHKNFNQNEKDHTKNIATKDSKQDTAKQPKEQVDGAGAGQQDRQNMVAVERPDALDTVDEWLATILKKCEQDDAELSKYMIKAAVGEQLAGQDGQNCW